MGENDSQITTLLRRVAGGERDAEAELFDAIYGQLRGLARSMLAGERRDHSLQATALVHEAFLRLRGNAIDWQNRQHFFAVAARAMRRILVDHARARAALKRPNPAGRVDLDKAVTYDPEDPTMLLAVDAALRQLADIDARQASIVEMRFFAGLTEEEIGDVLRVSTRTIKREWRFAKLWLFERFQERARPQRGAEK